MRHIAVVGSGPSGCYLAEALLRAAPDCRVDVIDRLPTPFGLVRFGVAPDHQGTKAIARLLDRVLGKDAVGFFGHVEVGRDVRLAELHGLYDAVVLATGASEDRPLGIPGETLPGVVGSGRFVGWYNRHPDHAALDPDILALATARSVVIIGNGNVALDVARVLAKTEAEMAGSDLDPQIAAILASSAIRAIHIVGRRGSGDAKFSAHELSELGDLARAGVELQDADALGDSAGPIIDIFRGFAAAPAPSKATGSKPIRIVFHFGLDPVAFAGNDRVEQVRFRAAEGEVTLPADLVVTCIGYRARPCCTVMPEAGIFANLDGRIGDRLYVIGWAGRGPSGTIPSSRSHAQDLARHLAAEVTAGGSSGGAGLRALLERRGLPWVDYAGWRRIDALETGKAGPDRCRHKLTDLTEMLVAARAG